MRSTKVFCSAIMTLVSCVRNEYIDAMPTARMATIPAAMQASRKAFMTVHLNESKWAILQKSAAGNAQPRPQVDMLRRMPAS